MKKICIFLILCCGVLSACGLNGASSSNVISAQYVKTHQDVPTATTLIDSKSELEAYYDPTLPQKMDLTGAIATSDSKHSSNDVGLPSAVIDGDISDSLSAAWISATSTGGEYTPHWLQIDHLCKVFAIPLNPFCFSFDLNILL